MGLIKLLRPNNRHFLESLRSRFESQYRLINFTESRPSPKMKPEGPYMDSGLNHHHLPRSADLLRSTESFKMFGNTRSISLPLNFKQKSSTGKRDEVIQEFGV